MVEYSQLAEGKRLRKIILILLMLCGLWETKVLQTVHKPYDFVYAKA